MEPYKARARARSQDGSTCDGKGPGAIRIRPTLAEMLEKSSSKRLVWGPGAGVVAAGRLCPRRKRTGVASRP
jgi:hypothetical protein